MIKEISKKIYLPEHNNLVLVDISLPLSRDLSQGDPWMNEQLCNQYERGISNALKQFDISPVPNKYIDGQEFLVTCFPKHIYGVFYYDSEKIWVDADTISGIKKVDASFLLGHEVGHKISKYMDNKEIYKELSSIFDIPLSRKDMLEETFADLVGYAVSNESDYNYHIEAEHDKAEYAKRKVLGSIYKI